MDDRANSIMPIPFTLLCLSGMITLYASISDSAWYSIAASPLSAALVVMAYIVYGMGEN